MKININENICMHVLVFDLILYCYIVSLLDFEIKKNKP